MNANTDLINEQNQSNIINETVLNEVKSKINSDDRLYEISELFKNLGDHTRLKIINAIMISEMCVCDIAALLNMSQPAVSHHLKMLKLARLVKTKRKGKTVYYSLSDLHVELVFKMGLEHVIEK